jgi:hypothetical protein
MGRCYSDAPMNIHLSDSRMRIGVLLGFLIPLAVACQPKPVSPKISGNFTDAQKLYDQGKNEEAEVILLALQAEKPSDAQTHFLLGRIYKDTLFGPALPVERII